jgi:hypothetical protein
VAKHYRVTNPTISRLVCLAREKPQLLSELLGKRQEAAVERADLVERISGLAYAHKRLHTVESVRV